MKLYSAILSIALISTPVLAQDQKPAAPTPQTPPPPLITPEVHSDNSVTFRFRAPNAQEVKVAREGIPDQLPMHKDETGIWTVNSPSWPPDYYGYSVIVDGQRLIDPYNPLLKPNLLSTKTWFMCRVRHHCPGS